MPHLSRVDRVRGCLLGMAVGDALGAPLEGLSSQQIKIALRSGARTTLNGVQAWKRKPYRWRLRGLYSDDTQQAMALCDILLEHRRVDQERLADLYLSLATPKGAFSGAHRGIGRSFRQVLAALERGVPAHQAAQPGAGIGAAMRIAPVPLFLGDDPDALFEAVMAASLMTHRDIRSLSGAMAVVHAIRRLRRRRAARPQPPALGGLRPRQGREPDRPGVRRSCDQDRRARRAACPGPSPTPSRCSTSRATAPSTALVDEANRHGAEPSCKRPTQGFPPACIPTCLYLLLTTDSFEEAVSDVINLGGDADTAGAILGAMAGAYYGIDAIPKRWLDGLQNRDGIEARALALARALMPKGSRSPTWSPPSAS